MKVGIREMIFILLLMVIPVAAWWFDYRPSNAARDAVTKEIQIKRQKLGAVHYAIGTIGDLKREIDSLHEVMIKNVPFADQERSFICSRRSNLLL